MQADQPIPTNYGDYVALADTGVRHVALDEIASSIISRRGIVTFYGSLGVMDGFALREC